MPALQGRLFYGWVIVVAAWLAMFVCSASIASFSIFAPELEREFGWTRGMLSVGYTLNTITIAVFGLVAGMLVDRIGIRRLVMIGAVIGGLGNGFAKPDNPALAFLPSIRYPRTLWYLVMLYCPNGSHGAALVYASSSCCHSYRDDRLRAGGGNPNSVNPSYYWGLLAGAKATSYSGSSWR